MGLGEAFELGVKEKLALLVGVVEVGGEQAAKQTGQDSNGQKEAWPATDPTQAVKRKSTGRYHAMKMRMKHEGLTPGVEHGEEAEPGAQMLRVGGDSQQRFRDCAEEQIVNHSRVLKRKLGKRVREGEDYVVVGHRQQFFLASLQPFSFSQRLAFGTVAVAAGVVNRDLMSAAIALVEVTAERSSSTQANGSHDAALPWSSPVAVLLEESFAVLLVSASTTAGHEDFARPRTGSPFARSA